MFIKRYNSCQSRLCPARLWVGHSWGAGRLPRNGFPRPATGAVNVPLFLFADVQYYFAIIKYYIALSAGGRAIHESFNPFFPCLPFRNVSSLRPAARRAPRTPTPNSTVTAPPPRRSTSNPATIVSGRPNCPTGFSSGGCAPSGATKPNSAASNASSAPTRSRRSISRWKSS